jgi:phenylalanyl-tRNA synthetase beta subunit
VLAPSRSQGSSEGTSHSQTFKLWSVYPFITRDISVWVPSSVSADELKKIYQELGTELLVREPELVDKFEKGDKTSYAFRLVFQSYDRTLTDSEISEIMTNITSKIVSLGYEVR